MALVLVLVVLAAAILGGRWGGAASAIVSALCFDFFFTRPYYSFTINNRDDIETTIVLLIVGLAVGELVVRTRRSRQVAQASRREVEQVRRVSALGAGGEAAGKLIQIMQRELVEALGVASAALRAAALHDRAAAPRARQCDDPGARERHPGGPAQRGGTPGVGARPSSSDASCWYSRLTRQESRSTPTTGRLRSALADQLGAALAATAETS